MKLSNDGKIVTTSNAVEGTYKVKATLKCNTAVSATILVNVKNQANIKSLTVTQKKITLTTKGNRSASKNLFKYVSSKASKEIKATNLIWESSDISVATVTKEGVVESVVGNKGKAVITATAKDGSGKQVKFTVTVKQLATKVTISGENKLGKGNNIVLKAVVAPKSAASQKVGWEITKYPDKADKSQVKITATNTATIGSYTIKATTLDGSNQSVTHVVTIQEAVKLVDIKEENYTLYRVSGGETINARTAKNITVTCKTTLDKDSTNLEVLNTAPGIVDATYDATNKRIKIYKNK